MTALVTGATGTLGHAVVKRLVTQGETVKILTRYRDKGISLFPNLEIIEGDINNLNIPDPKVDCVYHLAANLFLGEGRNEDLWHTNVIGTNNVLMMMKRYSIPRLYYCSTAYHDDRNYYEVTKRLAEQLIRESGICTTIFKPSIIVADSRTLAAQTIQHIYLWTLIVARANHRLGIVRKSIEGTLRLLPKVIGCRVRGSPAASLNLVPVDWVADTIAAIKGEGEWWLTNHRALPVQQFFDWVGEVLFLDLQVKPHFQMAPNEADVERFGKPLIAYIQEPIRFPSSFADCPPITKDFIQKTAKNCLRTD